MDASTMSELLLRKEKLLPELKPYERTSKTLGTMIHHPLLIEMFYHPDHAALLNERYRQKKEAVAEAFEKGLWSSYIFLHERPYRIGALLRAVQKGMSEEAHLRLVGDVWVDSENIWQHKSEWNLIWRSLKNPQAVMSAEEKTRFDHLPDEVTVWRGVRHHTHWLKGLSWTMDKERAVWFAHRLATTKNRPVVVKGLVAKSRILSYFDARNESEVVAFGKDVTVLEKDKR